MKNFTGLLGSGLLHVALAAIVVSSLFMAVREEKKLDRPIDTIVLVPGSGEETSRPSGPNCSHSGGFTSVSVLNPKKLMEQWRASHAVDTLPNTPVAPTGNPSAISPKVPGSTALKPKSIVGAQVGAGSLASLAAGVSGDERVSGSQGGQTEGVPDAFTAEVRAKFAAVFLPLFEQRGDNAAGRDYGEILITVSPSGLTSFAGWRVRPVDVVFERVVREAVEGMSAVTPPAGGKSETVFLRVSGGLSP